MDRTDTCIFMLAVGMFINAYTIYRNTCIMRTMVDNCEKKHEKKTNHS